MPRQRTLRALVDWSYDLLSAGERTVLDTLSVFAGSFSLEAAERVCADDAVNDAGVLDAVGHLVAKSLLIAEQLVVTEAAVKQHLLRLYDKFGVYDSGERRRVRLANEAIRRGAVTLSDLRETPTA